MKTRMSMAWTAAAALAGLGIGGDAPKPAINYNLSGSNLPAPAVLKHARPMTPMATVESMPALPELAPRKAEPLKPMTEPVKLKAELLPTTAEALKPIETTMGPAVAPPKTWVPDPLPPTPTAMKREMPVEPAVMKPTAQTPLVMPVAAYLATAEDHAKCVECLKTLSGSPIESDRKAALAELSRNRAWTKMKSAYMILRRVALTEYNTKMRTDAVKLLGEARMEHALAADTLKLSAMYDSDEAIRTAAMSTLERMAAMPPDRMPR